MGREEAKMYRCPYIYVKMYDQSRSISHQANKMNGRDYCLWVTQGIKNHYSTEAGYQVGI